MIAKFREKVQVVEPIHTGLYEEISSDSFTVCSLRNSETSSATVTFTMKDARADRIIQDTCCPETWVVARAENI